MLAEKTRDLVNEVNGLKEDLLNQYGTSILDMDTPEFDTIKKSLNLFDKMMDLGLEQAECIDNINSKLDLLVARSES